MDRRDAGRFRTWQAAALLLAIVSIWLVLRPELSGPHVFLPEVDGRATGRFVYDVPLDPLSPWPKFRANAVQNGRSPVVPTVDASRRPWAFMTGKGVFSSPVVDAEGTVYIGSADRHFYAIDRTGALRWEFETG